MKKVIAGLKLQLAKRNERVSIRGLRFLMKNG
jgi:hypothetical protein